MSSIWERWRARRIARRVGLPYATVLRWVRHEPFTEEDAQTFAKMWIDHLMEMQTGLPVERLRQMEKGDA